MLLVTNIELPLIFRFCLVTSWLDPRQSTAKVTLDVQVVELLSFLFGAIREQIPSSHKQAEKNGTCAH
jgi:hypothetical protein